MKNQSTTFILKNYGMIRYLKIDFRQELMRSLSSYAQTLLTMKRVSSSGENRLNFWNGFFLLDFVIFKLFVSFVNFSIIIAEKIQNSHSIGIFSNILEK